MSKYLFKQAEFLQSTLTTPPVFIHDRHKTLPQIAVVGRSNVGKSSLINHFFNQKNLAKVSGKPGKTSTINYFDVDNQLIFVDLPGYGYAIRSREVQKGWSVAIDAYMNHCSFLSLLILLIDSRRTPVKDDFAMVEWAQHYKKPILLIFTKFDTLREENREKIKDHAKALSIDSYLCYSTKNSVYRKMLTTALNKILWV